MTAEEAAFFNGAEKYLPLYIRLADALAAAYPDLRVRVSKTQISFYNRHMFAMVSLPARRKKDWPREYLLVSFGLGCRLESPRVAACAEPYPGRWTHHVTVQREEEIDGELLSWIDGAYRFSEAKR